METKKVVSKAKPLSFSTTIRNPERIPNFIKCILPYEGKILTSEIIHEIVKKVINAKEYKTMYELRNPQYKTIYKDDELVFTDAQLEDIIIHSPQKHKEAGFDEGWDSRFDTWYKFIKELGFVKYSMNNPIVISSTGHMLVDALMANPCDNKKIQKVFLNALIKYQTNNPLRRNLNENVPLPLLLSVIQLFHDDPEENNAGLARHELPILICWTNNNAIEVYKFIKDIRKEKGFKCSDEYIYDKCLSILGSDNKKYLKMKKICKEAVDEYIRKMRASGLLSLRGNGRFLDINSFEQESVSYIIDKYMTYPKFDTEDEYFDYMCTVDSTVLQIEISSEIDISNIRKQTLYKYANDNTREFIKNELMVVCRKEESHDAVLRYISAPIRLEFLTSVALVQAFKGLDVNPNYAVDDEGLPTFTASGGMADIECFDSDYDSYFEVTLMCGRSDQVNNEIIPIARHLKEIKEKRREESFSVLVAPTIHSDTIEAAEWQKLKNKVDILTFNISQFISNIEKLNKASEFLNVVVE